MSPTRVALPAVAFALALVVGAGLLLASRARAQARLEPAVPTPPTLEQVRRDMAIPSTGLELRGQRDSTGYASTAAQMERAWTLAASPPAPDSFGALPAPGVAAVLCPHDDYLYAGRVYRRVIPLLTARVVVMVGVFHGYRRFGAHDRLVFDPYRAWRTPDGPVPVSNLRERLLARLPRADWVQDAAAHDSEHSLEALLYWIRHQRPDVEIVPLIVPSMSFSRMRDLAAHLSVALAAECEARHWVLGRDVAVAISTDGIHYGPDFHQTTFGPGGIAAYEQAVEKDRGLLLDPLSGTLTLEKARALYATFVDPEHPDTYRWTWCGRFSVPFGCLLLEDLAASPGAAGAAALHVVAHPVAYATSVGWPELPLRDAGLGATAPASLYHFVGYPAAAFTIERGAAPAP